MSRIDLCVKERATGTLLVNRGFCRSPHVTACCEASEDPLVRDFGQELLLGLYITESNVGAVLETIAYTVGYLERLDAEARKQTISSYQDDSVQVFVADLRAGHAFLQALRQEPDFALLEVFLG